MDTEKERQRRHHDARLTESENARSEQLLVVPTESLTNRVWLEWIRTSKARLVLDMKYQKKKQKTNNKTPPTTKNFIKA